MKNKLIKNSRNKLKHSYSLENKATSQNKFDNYNTTIYKAKNIIISSVQTKSTNVNSKIDNIKSFSNKNNLIKFKVPKEKEFQIIKNNSNKFFARNKRRDKLKLSKRIFESNKRILNKTKININNHINNEFKKDDDNKIYILPDYIKVKNFSLKSSKILDYLNLNKDNNLISDEKNCINKLTKKFNLYNVRKIKRNGSYTNINNRKKIDDIYPTLFNIEGKIDRRLLNELENKNKRKMKKEMLNNMFLKKSHYLRKQLMYEKNKAIEESYKTIYNISYDKKLALYTMKFFKNDLDHLKRKISFKFNIKLPLYNLFLNLDY
jgi:hypothetical protein